MSPGPWNMCACIRAHIHACSLGMQLRYVCHTRSLRMGALPRRSLVRSRRRPYHRPNDETRDDRNGLLDVINMRVCMHGTALSLLLLSCWC